MRIALVRGPSLNQFEMQYYEPLAKKHEIVCFTSTRPVYDIRRIDLPIVRLPCLGQVLGGIPGAIRGLYWLLGDPQGLIGLENKLSGFDIAHTAELFSYYTHQALRAKKRGGVKKVVATVSENIPFNQEWYPKQKALKKFALRNLDHILAISGLSKKAMMIEGYPEEKITVVPHGLDLKKFKVQSEKLKVKNKFTILFVGRLEEEKGVWELLRAFKGLKKRHKDLQLVMIGQGSQEKKIKDWLGNNKLKESVWLKGRVKYRNIEREYHQADIFVLPSKPTLTWQEQFGMVLIEAMACGVPVVSTKSGAIPEIVGEEGILVSPNNWFELAGALKKLIFDQKLRESLAKKGRERVKKRFDRMIVAQKIEEIYQKVLRK